MCVQSNGYDWERPVEVSDLPIIAAQFPGIELGGLYQAMAADQARPLTTDIVLAAAMLSSEPDDLGMCFVPFAGLADNGRDVVKLPVMEQIVDWFENSALGSDMWEQASAWAEANHGGRFHFAMNCGCGLVATAAKTTGAWQRWKVRFNRSRREAYGRTSVIVRDTNTVQGCDITPSQLSMWFRIRRCLEALPGVQLMQSPQVLRSELWSLPSEMNFSSLG